MPANGVGLLESTPWPRAHSLLSARACVSGVVGVALKVNTSLA